SPRTPRRRRRARELLARPLPVDLLRAGARLPVRAIVPPFDARAREPARRASRVDRPHGGREARGSALDGIGAAPCLALGDDEAARPGPAPPEKRLTIALAAIARHMQMNDFSRAPRVLVVEDDEDIAQALQRSLRMEGYEVRAAADGPTALEHGRAFAPDLVILDLGLPGIDGLEVARTLRAEDDVPILILTARDALEARVEGLDAGADDYLVKPFERQE